MRPITHPAAAILLALAACADQPGLTGSGEPDVVPSAAFVSPVAPGHAVSEHACFASRATPGTAIPYRYARRNLYFAAHGRAIRGRLLYRYREVTPGGELIRLANCTIPASATAVAAMDALFRVPPVLAAARRRGTAIRFGCVAEGGPCPLEPVTVVAPPQPREEDPPQIDPWDPCAVPSNCGGGGPDPEVPGGEESCLDCVPTSPILACTGVARGETATCRIDAGGATPPPVQGWAWKNQWGETIVRSGATAPEWSGVAVASGTVEAALAGGVLAAPLAVRSRGWKWNPATQWSFVQGAAVTFCASTEPVVGVPEMWGWNMNLNTCRADAGRFLPDMNADPYGGFTIAAVSGGPNDGWWYVSEVRYRMERGSNVHAGILPSAPKRLLSNPVQVGQCQAAMQLPSTSPVWVNFYTFNEQCMGIDVDGITAAIFLHEGYGLNGNNGHESVARALAVQPQWDPYAGADTLVSRDPDFLRSLVSSTAWERNQEVTNEGASHVHVHGNWPGGNLTYWMWHPGLNRYTVTTLSLSL